MVIAKRGFPFANRRIRKAFLGYDHVGLVPNILYGFRFILCALYGRGAEMGKNNSVPDRVQGVWNKIGGDSEVDRLLAGELRIVETNPPYFPVWKTVRLGLHISSQQYREALKSSGVVIDEWGEYVLGRTPFSLDEYDVNLTRPSVADLGFRHGASYSDICERGQRFCLRLCPAEIGPALRLQYLDQLAGESLKVAMTPIKSKSGKCDGFCIMNHKKHNLCLSGYEADPEMTWWPDERLVFVHSRI